MTTNYYRYITFLFLETVLYPHPEEDFFTGLSPQALLVENFAWRCFSQASLVTER